MVVVLMMMVVMFVVVVLVMSIVMMTMVVFICWSFIWWSLVNGSSCRSSSGRETFHSTTTPGIFSQWQRTYFATTTTIVSLERAVWVDHNCFPSGLGRRRRRRRFSSDELSCDVHLQQRMKN